MSWDWLVYLFWVPVFTCTDKLLILSNIYRLYWICVDSIIFGLFIFYSLHNLQWHRDTSPLQTNINKSAGKPHLWRSCVCLCVVRRCALTRGDPWGSPTQSFGLVRHPQPELQQFTRSPLSLMRRSKLSSDSSSRLLWKQIQQLYTLIFYGLKL